MLSIIGSLLGFAGSAAPAVMDHFKSKQNNKLELDKMRLHAELRKEGYDYDMKMFDPDHPNTGFAEFESAMLRGVASGLNVSYAALSSDLSSVNYSGGIIITDWYSELGW